MLAYYFGTRKSLILPSLESYVENMNFWVGVIGRSLFHLALITFTMAEVLLLCILGVDNMWANKNQPCTSDDWGYQAIWLVSELHL